MSPAERKPRKNEIVAQRIREYIVEHGLRPGDRLPTEDDLATLFEVSRVSVREATRGLAMLGVLESAPRRGLTVGKVDLERIAEYIGFHLQMGEYPKDHLIETRVIIETGGLEHVAKRMQEFPEVYDELDQLNDRLRTTRSSEDWIKLDREFHTKLVEAAGLEVLTAFGKLVHLFFDRFRDDFPEAQWRDGIAAHQRILDYLKSGDCKLATGEMRAHIESHRGRGTE